MDFAAPVRAAADLAAAVDFPADADLVAAVDLAVIECAEVRFAEAVDLVEFLTVPVAFDPVPLGPVCPPAKAARAASAATGTEMASARKKPV